MSPADLQQPGMYRSTVASGAAQSPAEKLRVAFDLFEVGVEMMRRRLVRENPDADDAEVEDLLTAWLHDRPGAEFGDHPGPASTRPLFRA